MECGHIIISAVGMSQPSYFTCLQMSQTLNLSFTYFQALQLSEIPNNGTVLHLLSMEDSLILIPRKH